MKLYEITNIMRALLDTLSDRAVHTPGQEADPDHEHALTAFEQTTEDMDAKLRSVIAYSLELDAEVEARIAVIDRMQKANERDHRKAEWLREYAKGAIQAVNLPLPRKYTEFTLSLAKVPRTAEIVDESAVPARYKTKIIPEPVVKIDKAAINKDARDGELIPGVRLCPQTYRLTIK